MVRRGLRGAWIAGGVMLRDSTLVSVPWVYYSNLRPDSAGHPPARLAVGQARGVYATVQGKVWRDVGIEATGTRWDSRDFFLPVLELRTDLFLRTRWLSRFPSGDFGVNANGIFEYRSSTEFPVGGPKPASVERITATGSRVLSTLLELRIKSAYITWQYRNIIGNGTPYALVPGYVMPRLTNLYGVRWEFFN